MPVNLIERESLLPNRVDDNMDISENVFVMLIMRTLAVYRNHALIQKHFNSGGDVQKTQIGLHVKYIDIRGI